MTSTGSGFSRCATRAVTVAQVFDGCALRAACDITAEFNQPCQPGCELIWADHYDKRQRLLELLRQGYFPFQAVIGAGLGPTTSEQDVEEL
jgi:hypothetical protein